jgi:hypothetical protein
MLEPGERKKIHTLDTQGIDRHASFVKLELAGEPLLTRWALLCEPKALTIGQPQLAYEILGNRLDLHVTGVAFDAYVADADDRANLRPLGNGVQTVMSGALCFEFDRKPRKLLFRSLAGCQELEIG